MGKLRHKEGKQLAHVTAVMRIRHWRLKLVSNSKVCRLLCCNFCLKSYSNSVGDAELEVRFLTGHRVTLEDGATQRFLCKWQYRSSSSVLSQQKARETVAERKRQPACHPSSPAPPSPPRRLFYHSQTPVDGSLVLDL